MPDPEADLTDEEAAALAPYLPTLKSSSTVTNIDVLNAAIWRARTGRPLSHLPERFGSYEVIRKRLERWAIVGAWDELLTRIDELDLSEDRRREIQRIAERLAAKGARIRAKRRA